LNRYDFELQFKILTHEDFRNKAFRFDIKFKSDFETKDIFQKWKVIIFERLPRRFVFKFESLSDFKESERLLIALKSKPIHQ
jgi:hypothetical protein